MKVPSLVKLNLSVTERCNFSCSYCYQKNLKKKDRLNPETVERVIQFFFPWLSEGGYIGFYGGEPLLEFSLIEQAVQFSQRLSKTQQKKILYTITTNGSLLTESLLEFFNRHRFHLTLSFDGSAQDQNRKEGSRDQLLTLIPIILKNFSGIDLTVNSVFSPETVHSFVDSLQMIRQLGVKNSIHAFSTAEPWSERDFRRLIRERRRMATLFTAPEENNPGEKKKRQLFICAAGLDRISLSAEGKLWGCYLFGDYFKERLDDEDYSRYCFGSLDEFISEWESIYPGIAKNYGLLRQDYYYTEKGFCMDCPNLYHCHVCPITSILAGSVLLKKVPLHICRLQKINNRPWRK